MIRTTLTALALLGAVPAFAQDIRLPLPRESYTLGGGDHRGAVIRGDNEQTAEVQEARGVGFGQNLSNGWHSRDRGNTVIALTSIDRDTGVRQSFVGAFVATIKDLGDQGKASPASITLRAADGSVIDSIDITGKSTKRANGNVRRVGFSGPLNGASLVIRTAAGKFNLNPDKGTPGDGDGFSVKVKTADDCPPDEGPNMTMTTERSRETISSAPKPNRSKSGDSNNGRGGNGGKNGKGGKGGKGKK